MDTNSLLRQLPKVDALLLRDDVEALSATVPRMLVVEAVRSTLDETRAAILAGSAAEVSTDALASRAIERARASAR